MQAKLRGDMIRVAYCTRNPILKSALLGLLSRRAETAEEETPGKGGVGGLFLEFMKEEGDRRVHNPDTGNQVKVKSLKGPKGKEVVHRLFEQWLDQRKKTEKPADPAKESEEEKPSKGGFPTLKLKPDRYKDKLVQIGRKQTSDEKAECEDTTKAFLDAAGVDDLSDEFLADLIGAPVLTGSSTNEYQIKTFYAMDGVKVNLKGKHIVSMLRTLSLDEKGGEPYIYNDVLVLAKNAPKGLGTKIFAGEVAAARASGIKSIQTSAHRDRDDPSWVGYKVWPKLGYDGPIPFAEMAFSQLPKDLEDKVKEAGFKKPYMVSHLYRVEGGMEWWEENGESFHASFDTTDGSQSMEVLSAYIAAKAAKEKLSTEDWMARTAAKKEDEQKKDDKKTKKQYENIELDKHDNEVLAAIWKKLRK